MIDGLIDFLELTGTYKERAANALEKGAYGKQSRFFTGKCNDTLVIYFDIHDGVLGTLKSHYYSINLQERRHWVKIDNTYKYTVVEKA